MNPVIYISRKKISRILLVVVGILFLAGLVSNVLQLLSVHGSLLTQIKKSYIRLFSLDLEANIPTWFSSCLLFLCSALLTLIAVAVRTTKGRYFFHWGMLSAIFLYMSLDETAIIHEMAIKPVRALLHTTGYLYYAWVIPAGVILIILGVVYLKFLADLPSSIRWLFVTAGVVYVGGLMGLESVTGRLAERYGEGSLTYQLVSSIEEFFEMVGLVIFIYALLKYLRVHHAEYFLRIGD